MIVSQQLFTCEMDVVGAVLDEWRGRWPAMGVLVLLPEAEKAKIAALQAVFRERGVPLAGAVFPTLVSERGFLANGVALLGFEEMPPHFLVSVRGEQAAEAIVPLARAALERLESKVPPTLFMIFDGMVPNVSSILHGLFLALGERVAYRGVNAGSETFQPMPCLFDDQAVIGDGVLGLLLSKSGDIVVKHGYPVSKSLMRATSTEGNRIDAIDHRPAFDAYREVIRQECGVLLTHANFYDYAVHFPFGLITAVDVLVRIPVAFNDDGSLFCVGEVPPNSMLRLLQAPAAENSNCVAELAADLRVHRGATQGHPLLTFYCAGRRMHLGQGAVDELAELSATTGASGIIGALSLGEIDQLRDLSLPRFHNAAVVCLSLPVTA